MLDGELAAGERDCLWVTGFERGQAGDGHQGPSTAWGFWPRASVHLVPRQVTHPGFGRTVSGSAGLGPARSGRVVSKFY